MRLTVKYGHPRLAHEDGYCVAIATHDLAILPRMDIVYSMNSGVLTQTQPAPEKDSVEDDSKEDDEA